MRIPQGVRLKGVPDLRCRGRADRPCLGSLLLLAASWLITAEVTHARDPWRLSDRLPERISLSVEHRTRFEHNDEQYDVGRSGDESVLIFRTLVDGRFSLSDHLTVGAELQDSRTIYRNDTKLGTDIVNAVELLRAYVELEMSEMWGGTLTTQVGRITMNVGSRRLVARSRFRNTINAFNGVDLRWKTSDDAELRAFWTMPLKRQPAQERRLRDNDVVFDRESLDVQLWGVFAGADLERIGRGELYTFGLHEDSTNDGRTRNRILYTPGFRISRPPAPGRLDYELETVFQTGRSRASTSSNQTLTHFAHFHHAEVGYSFDARWSPRVVLQYDYASGDDKPGDGNNERFDTLFGARRFEYGPTGIYGAFARSNINTPGIRIQLEPMSWLQGFLAYRAFWLASDRDAWTTTGLRDPRGKSGSFVGSQLEFRIRWKLLPGNLMLETGYAHLFAGEFIKDAPNASHRGNSNYGYSQVVVTF